MEQSDDMDSTCNSLISIAPRAIFCRYKRPSLFPMPRALGALVENCQHSGYIQASDAWLGALYVRLVLP